MEEGLRSVRENPEALVQYMARKKFSFFARYIHPSLEMTPFHKCYYEVLDSFAKGRIKRLIVSAPPQHGKSEASSRLLPAFLLGLNPDLKVMIGSYNAEMAHSFNYDVQRIINGDAYKAVFPDSFLNTSRARMDNVYKCNAEVSEMVGRGGGLRAVGRSGPLTGKSVDISILDDVYKDYNEANSPLVRNLAWKWYTTVVRTRLHNDSQELIVFTRWHEDDLIGRIEKAGERVIPLASLESLESIPPKAWVLINYKAIKVGPPTPIDPREDGEALWPTRHSIGKLIEARALDPVQFECLYQGDPSSAEGRLYGQFKTYSTKEEWGYFIRRGAYIDVADQGDDDLCSVVYDIYKSKQTIFNEKKKMWEPLMFVLVRDIILTNEGTEVTLTLVPEQLNLHGVQRAWVESNNGGQQFANSLEKRVRAQVVKFYNGASKETRILTNSSEVMRAIVMPLGWESKYPKAHEHLERFLRNYRANAHDDIEDTLTGIVEKEILSNNTRAYRNRSHSGVRRRN